MDTARRIILGALAFTCMAGITPAYADKGGHGHDYSGREWDDSYVKRSYVPAKEIFHDNSGAIRIYDNDRVVLSRYTEEVYYKSCPPGLAKKASGCVPPGQTVKRYEIGDRLPDTVKYYVVPQEVVVNLRPVPTGYQYVRVDNDVLLMNQTDRHIVDSVTWFPAQ